jgi:hypothetical protein
VAVVVQVLTSPGCGHGARTVELVREAMARLAPAASLEVITVATPEDAERLGCPGSPTVRVNGTDIDPFRPSSVGLG